MTDPNLLGSHYHTGYCDGESSMSADWHFALTEQGGVPSETAESPTATAAYIKALIAERDEARADRDEARAKRDEEDRHIAAMVPRLNKAEAERDEAAYWDGEQRARAEIAEAEVARLKALLGTVQHWCWKHGKEPEWLERVEAALATEDAP